MPYVKKTLDQLPGGNGLTPQQGVAKIQSSGGGNWMPTGFGQVHQVDTSGGPPAGPSMPQEGAEGGNFANLQRYLQINQGQAQGMANTLAGGVESQAAALQNPAATATANTQFTGKGPGMAQKTGAVNAYSGAYQPAGPGDLRNRQDVANQTAARAKELGTYGGRQDLLSQTYGHGSEYTGGMNNLDNFLVGSVAGDRFQQDASKFGGLGDYVRQHTASPTPWGTTTAAAAAEGEKKKKTAAAALAAAAGVVHQPEDDLKNKKGHGESVHNGQIPLLGLSNLFNRP